MHVGTIVGLVVAGFGLVLMVLGIRDYRRRRAEAVAAAGSWRSVMGDLHEAGLHEELERDAENDLVTVFSPIVRYGYRVGERDFASTRAFFGRTRFDSEAKARKWAAANPAGHRVTVWYDPADPAQSALEIDQPSLGGAIFNAFLGAVFVLIGVVALLD